MIGNGNMILRSKVLILNLKFGMLTDASPQKFTLKVEKE